MSNKTHKLQQNHDHSSHPMWRAARACSAFQRPSASLRVPLARPLSSASSVITPYRHTPVDIDDWAHNERYHNALLLLKQDQVLHDVLANCEKNGLPRLQLSEAQGKFLGLLARSLNAARILEVGTLGGYPLLSPTTLSNNSGNIPATQLSGLQRHCRLAAESSH